MTEVKSTSQPQQTIHFVGICGTAMASVAALCRQLGHTVTGSDEQVYPPMSTFLEEQGITIAEGYTAAHLDSEPDRIVIGNAMKRGNPEVERCLDEELPLCSLPALVREYLLPGTHTVVVAGTHGKTTTTSLLAWVLESAGLAPGFLIGGVPLNFGCGARVASASSPPVSSTPQRPVFVIEGDEYDTAFFDKRSKFVHYRPHTVILNNIEFDHADIFRDLEAVKRSFQQLVAIIPRHGRLIANRDDAVVRELAEQAFCQVDWFHSGDADGYQLPLPGAHNQTNAAAVVVCARSLGLTLDQIQAGFASFRGVKRRMEVRGEEAGVIVLDDFAHHPTAILSTLQAIRQAYPGHRLWAVFEARSNTTRRRVFQTRLGDALAAADGVYIAKVDRLAELPEDDRLQPSQIVLALEEQGKAAFFLPTAEQIIADLVPRLQAGDVVAVLSNGSFDEIHEKLLRTLRTR